MTMSPNSGKARFAMPFNTRFKVTSLLGLFLTSLVVALACSNHPEGVETDPAVKAQKFPREKFSDKIKDHADKMLEEGRETFRYDTFGSEAFWGDQLQLHKAILRDKKGGIGEGLSARKALQVGLKVDSDKLPRLLLEVIREGSVKLDDPDTTLELIRADSVVGLKGVFDKDKNMKSLGITCALCHATVDDTLMKGIGRRLDGWP